MFHVNQYKLIGFKNIEVLNHIWNTNQRLEDLGLTANNGNLLRMKPLLVNYLERCSFWVAFLIHIAIKLVLDHYNHSVLSLAK